MLYYVNWKLRGGKIGSIDYNHYQVIFAELAVMYSVVGTNG